MGARGAPARIRLQQGRRRADGIPMLLVALALLAFAGCAMPNKGTPIFVDMRGGEFWSGRGKLLEVSEDQSRCRIAVRDRALLVQKLWVDCAWVHPRHDRG
jgi:hypothetical protein